MAAVEDQEMVATLEDSLLFSFLVRAEKRPGMYFGSRAIEVVANHLDGWHSHRLVCGDNDEFAENFFIKLGRSRNFHEFVARRYNERRTIGWARIIHNQCGAVEEEYPLFMSLVRQFAKDTIASE